MKRSCVVRSAILILISVFDGSGQKPPSPLESYIASADTIVIARCLASGPADILFRSNVEVEVLHVVKGDPKVKNRRLKLGGGLVKGEVYLIRLADPAKSNEKVVFGNEGANVVPVSRDDDLELIKTLSPRTVVLRTINRRIDELRYVIQRSTYELGGLAAIKASD